MNSIVDATPATFQHTIDFTTRVHHKVVAVDRTELFNVAIKYLNATVGVPLTRMLRVFTKLPSAYNWTTEIKELVSGENNKYPFKFSSIFFFCLSNIASGLVWINTLGLDYLGYLASCTASLPFLTQCIESLPLLGYQCEFFGTVLDAVDAARELLNHHRVTYNTLRITGNIAQIIGILFINSTAHLLVIATIANGTANILYLARFALDYYKYI